MNELKEMLKQLKLFLIGEALDAKENKSVYFVEDQHHNERVYEYEEIVKMYDEKVKKNDPFNND